MNEIEQTIENLEYFIGGDCCDNQMDFIEEIEMALAALREKQERDKGCEYCNSRFGIATHHINGQLLQAGTKKIAIYCPMCGKRLEVEP